MQKTCITCNEKLTGKQQKHCSVKCKNKTHMGTYEYQKARGSKRRTAIIKESGGSCTHCGYNKNEAALCFHHTNPEEKLFPLDIRSVGNHSMKKVRAELKKCVLLCANCHAEEHYPDRKMS